MSAMDRTADPCEDLYQYSCGGWIKSNPLPDDQADWSVYRKLSEGNQRYLWGLLAAAASRMAQSADLHHSRRDPRTTIGCLCRLRLT